MEWEKLLAEAAQLATRGSQLKGIAEIGSSSEDITEYMKERESFLDDSVKFQMELPGAMEKQFEAINEIIKNLRNEVREYRQPTKELTRADVGRAIAKAALFALHGIDAFSEKGREDLKNIVVPGGFNNDKTMRNYLFQRNGQKDAVDSELIPGGTNAGLIVNPIYERELIKYAREESDLIGIVRKMPMLTLVHSFPALDSRNMTLTRTTSTSSGSSYAADTKMFNSATGPTFGSRVELRATTMGAYIPWIDEFRDDMQINDTLANLMLECWLEAYGEDFDKNLLTADSDDTDEYDGLLNTDGVLTHTISSSSIEGMSPHELNTALLKISRKERDGGMWLVNETVLSAMMQKRDANGNYMFWSPPTGEKPGKLANAPYLEAHLMPDYSEINAGDAFMAYVHPKNMWAGELAGVEVKQFDATIYGLEYGENFTRWRVRNGFKIVKPEAAVIVKLRS